MCSATIWVWTLWSHSLPLSNMTNTLFSASESLGGTDAIHRRGRPPRGHRICWSALMCVLSSASQGQRGVCVCVCVSCPQRPKASLSLFMQPSRTRKATPKEFLFFLADVFVPRSWWSLLYVYCCGAYLFLFVCTFCPYLTVCFDFKKKY